MIIFKILREVLMNALGAVMLCSSAILAVAVGVLVGFLIFYLMSI